MSECNHLWRTVEGDTVCSKCHMNWPKPKPPPAEAREWVDLLNHTQLGINQMNAAYQRLERELAEANRQLNNCWEDRGAFWKDECAKACGQRDLARAELAEGEYQRLVHEKRANEFLDKLTAAEARVKELEEYIYESKRDALK